MVVVAVAVIVVLLVVVVVAVVVVFVVFVVAVVVVVLLLLLLLMLLMLLSLWLLSLKPKARNLSLCLIHFLGEVVLAARRQPWDGGGGARRRERGWGCRGAYNLKTGVGLLVIFCRVSPTPENLKLEM